MSPADDRRPTPVWVTVFLVLIGIAVLALAVSFVLGVEHGPGRHGAGAAVNMPAAAITA